MKLGLSKQEFLVLAAIVVFVALFFKPVIAGDGFGYYVILEGAVRDHSLNVSNQLHYNVAAKGPEVMFWQPTGVYFSQYAPGLPLLSAPLYAISLLLDDLRFLHVNDSFFLQERGDILVHMASVAITSLIFVAVALLLSLKLLKKLGLQKHSALALLLAFFGTPIIRYATYDLTYTHAVEAGLLAAIVYLFVVEEKKSLWIGLLLGLMTLVRYTSIVFAVPFLAYYIWKRKNNDARNIIVGVIPFVAAILLYWWHLFGSPFITSYYASSVVQGSGSFLSLLPVYIPTVLFSFAADPPGLLWWTPVAIVSLLGVWHWKSDKKWVLLGLFAMLLVVTGMSFGGTTGFSFSNRYFAALFVVYVVGCAVLLQKFGEKTKVVLGALALWTTLLFLLHLAGEYPSAFPHFASVWDYWFTQGNISSFPQKVFGKLGVVRLLLQK